MNEYKATRTHKSQTKSFQDIEQFSLINGCLICLLAFVWNVVLGVVLFVLLCCYGRKKESWQGNLCYLSRTLCSKLPLCQICSQTYVLSRFHLFHLHLETKDAHTSERQRRRCCIIFNYFVFMRHHTSMSKQKSAATYSCKLLLKEWFQQQPHTFLQLTLSVVLQFGKSATFPGIPLMIPSHWLPAARDAWQRWQHPKPFREVQPLAAEH